MGFEAGGSHWMAPPPPDYEEFEARVDRTRLVDDYLQAHSLQVRDSDAYLDEAAARKVPSSPTSGRSSISENCLEREKELGELRLEVARNHVRNQEEIFRGIQVKLAEHHQFDRDLAAETAATTALAAAAAAAASPARFRSLPTLHGGAGGSPDGMRAAQVAAEALERKRERLEKFKQRRLECMAQEEREREAVAEALREAEIRAAKHQCEKLERLRSKTFAVQQKRSEQQKMLKEIQRHQDRQLDLLQAKHQSSVPQLPQLPVHKASSSASSPRPRSGGPEDRTKKRKEGGAAGEAPGDVSYAGVPFYKEMLKSHALYNRELEQWEKRSQDNERRTEAHRKKILNGGNTEHEERARRNSKSVGNAVKAVKNIQDFVRRASTMSMSETLFADRADSVNRQSSAAVPVSAQTTQDTDYSGEKPDRGDSAASDHSSDLEGSGPTTHSPSIKWKMRRAQCMKHQKEQEERRQKILEKSIVRVEDARNRLVHNTERRGEMASRFLANWNAKRHVALRKEQQMESHRGFEVERREEEWTTRWGQEKEKVNERRTEHNANRGAVIKEVLATKAKLDSEAESHYRQRLAEKESRLSMVLHQRDEQLAIKAGGAARQAGLMRQKSEAKIKIEEEFREKTLHSLQSKQARSQEVIKRMHRPSTIDEALARHREKVGAVGSARTPRTGSKTPRTPQAEAVFRPRSPTVVGFGEEEEVGADSPVDEPKAPAGEGAGGPVVLTKSALRASTAAVKGVPPLARSSTRVSLAASMSDSQTFPKMSHMRSEPARPSRTVPLEDPPPGLDDSIGETGFQQELESWSAAELLKLRKRADPLSAT